MLRLSRASYGQGNVLSDFSASLHNTQNAETLTKTQKFVKTT
jgi:hypothetical protein